MSMICFLRQIAGADIEPLLKHPERIHDILDDENEEDEEGAAEVDLDKAWHGIHFLLTGTAWEGEPPLCYLLAGGREVGDEDVGYGPARVLAPVQVEAFARGLAGISTEQLRARFNPEAMKRAEIYPDIWGRDPKDDDTLGYLLEYFEVFRSFIRQTSEAHLGVLIYLA